ncbi:MAG: permease [Janthinobacterium lividum]
MSRPQPVATSVWGIVVFFAIAIAGLFYVKWSPYYHRTFVAASQHAIGNSILMGKASSAPPASLQAARDYAWAYGKAIWQAMVLGLLLGSAVQALLPPRWIANTLGRTGFGSVAAGGMLSLPSMMCTCCAAPVVVGLRQQRASAGGAIAFWLGNTVLNPATLVFMGFVLGWHWSALRLVLGVPMVFGTGYLVSRLATPIDAVAARAQLNTAVTGVEASGGAFARWMKILARMTLRLVPEYVVLVLLLGAARTWLFPHISPDIGNEVLWIAALAVAGMLFVIPTAGEVPIIQAMLSLGMAAGPAGALLMTLPPISLPSLVMVGRSFPARVLALVVASVVAFGLMGGLLAVLLRF